MSAEHIKLIKFNIRASQGTIGIFILVIHLVVSGSASAVRYQNLKTSCHFDSVIFLNEIIPIVSLLHLRYMRLPGYQQS